MAHITKRGETTTMKVERIITVIEKYEALKSRLYKDERDYKNYKVLESDDEKAQITLNKIRYDFEEIGKFLDMEV